MKNFGIGRDDEVPGIIDVWLGPWRHTFRTKRFYRWLASLQWEPVQVTGPPAAWMTPDGSVRLYCSHLAAAPTYMGVRMVPVP